jgi:hypothetical protein
MTYLREGEEIAQIRDIKCRNSDTTRVDERTEPYRTFSGYFVQASLRYTVGTIAEQLSFLLVASFRWISILPEET